jgi:hypothetical protein
MLRAASVVVLITLLCPEGATAQSPGLPLRLPWERKQSETDNRIAVATA